MKCRTDWPDANDTTARNNKACRNNLRGMTALLAKVQSEIQGKHTRCSEGEHSGEAAARRSHGNLIVFRAAPFFHRMAERCKRTERKVRKETTRPLSVESTNACRYRMPRPAQDLRWQSRSCARAEAWHPCRGMFRPARPQRRRKDSDHWNSGTHAGRAR